MHQGQASRHDAVIFDLGGTLANFSYASYGDCMVRVAGLLGVPAEGFEAGFTALLPEVELGRYNLSSAAEFVCKRLGTAVRHEDVAAAVSVWKEILRAGIVPREGVVETLQQLREEGLKTGVISGAGPETAELWADTPFACLIDEAVFSADVGINKPRPRIYRIACSRLEVQPNRCLYVGDGSDRELSGAAAVGMTAIQMRFLGEDEASRAWLGREEWAGPAVDSFAALMDFVLIRPNF